MSVRIHPGSGITRVEIHLSDTLRLFKQTEPALYAMADRRLPQQTQGHETIATRLEKSTENWLTLMKSASTRIWMRSIGP